MNYLVKTLSISVLLSITSLIGYSQTGYSLKFKINGIHDTVIYLANYYGGKQYYKDTTIVDSDGKFEFKGDKPLAGGIYSVVLPDQKSYFEMMIEDQDFYMETEKGDLVNKMKVKNSEENKLFYQYLQFVGVKQKETVPYRDIIKNKENDKTKIAEAREKLGAIDKEVKAYKRNLITKYPDYLMTKVFLCSEDPEVPKGEHKLTDGTVDKTYSFRYYKRHYLDGVDFTDERLIRTPVFHNKIDYYIKKLTVQHPDSITVSADYLALKAKANKELFKYVVHYITNQYEKSKIMGMDRVFVHMAKNYYETGQAFWVDSTQLAKISKRADKLAPLLVGEIAPNLILQDTTEKNWVDMHKIKSKYIVLFFWDSGCGHCKKAIPKLKKFYHKFKTKGVEIYAIGTEFENDKWKQFIIDKKLEWINVSDNPEINKNARKYIGITTLESLNFRDTYDIYSTPQVYLLDENKKILAKRLSVGQMDDMLSDKMDIEKTPASVYEDKKGTKKKSSSNH